MAATTLSVKALTDQYPKYNFPADDQVESLYKNEQMFDSTDPEYTIPTIDFSLLTSGDPEQRSKVLHDLRKACDEWGYFMVYIVNNIIVLYVYIYTCICVSIYIYVCISVFNL